MIVKYLARAVAIVADNMGRHVYISNSKDKTISQSAAGTGSTLSALTPATVTTGQSPGAMAIDSRDRYLYAINKYDATISGYLISSTGTLTAIFPAVAAGTGPSSIAINPTGTFLYTANFGGGDPSGGSLSQYFIGQDGVLSALSPGAVAAGNAWNSIGVDVSGKFAYAVNSENRTVAEFSIRTDGGLAAAASSPPTITGNFPGQLFFGAGGQSLYALSNLGVDVDTGYIAQFVISNGGAPQTNTPASLQVSSGMAVESLAFIGTFAYALSAFNIYNIGGSITQYTASSTGALSAVGTASPANINPIAMIMIAAHLH